MLRERLALSIAAVALGCLVSGPSTVDAQKIDPAARRLELLEKRVADLEAELQKVRLEQANDRLLNRLYGEWKEQFYVDRGRRRREEDNVIWELESEASSSRTLLAGEVSQWFYGKMTVDTSRNPAWITFHSRDDKGKEVILPGIISARYSFLGGSLERHLTIALPMSRIEGHTGGARPTTFESTETNGVMVFELQREGSKLR
jgi:outer membrane murein-binding lipoprotein Lpp